MGFSGVKSSNIIFSDLYDKFLFSFVYIGYIK